MALRYDVAGNETVVDEESLSIEGLRKILDCQTVEFVALRGEIEAWALAVDEDGRLLQKPVNERASVLRGGLIVGTAVLLGREEYRKVVDG